MRSLPSIVLFLLLAVDSLARGADGWQRHLPPEWFGVLVVHDLPEFDRHAERVAKLFGLEAPGLARLRKAAGLSEVTDAEGSWLVGLARGPQGAEQPYPFAMIPTRDFDGFVDALDGDMRGKAAVVTFAEQDLLAGDCGPWVLLMNPAEREVFDSVLERATDSSAAVELLPSTDGIAAVHVSKLGLQWLAHFESTNKLESRERATARRKRGPAVLSLDGVRERLVLDKPVWQWLAAEFEEVGVGVDFDQAGGARVRTSAAKPQAAEAGPSGEPELNEGFFDGREWISVGSFQPSEQLTKLATGGYLALLKSRPDELGAEEFAETEFEAFERSIEDAAGLVSGTLLATLANDKLPVYGNRAALLHVAQPRDFLAGCEEVMQRWNALIAASKAEVNLTFASEPIEIAGKSGRRFYVDMVEAVDVPRSPEVAKVMTDMFGPQGVLNWYVLLLDGDRVLVANLPMGDVKKLIEELKEEGVKPQAAGGTGWMKFDASAYVDWAKRRDRAMMGEVIGGPRFVPLPESAPLEAAMWVRDGAVDVELTLSPSLLETLGKHAQERR